MNRLVGRCSANLSLEIKIFVVVEILDNMLIPPF